MNTCETCRYWEGCEPIEGRAWVGKCRRRPPKAATAWPITASEDWCGEHQKGAESFEIPDFDPSTP